MVRRTNSGRNNAVLLSVLLIFCFVVAPVAAAAFAPHLAPTSQQSPAQPNLLSKGKHFERMSGVKGAFSGREMKLSAARTLYDKIFDEHCIPGVKEETPLLYIDRHLVHEVTSPQVRVKERQLERRAFQFFIRE
jgi:hypothetical protein